MTEKCQCEGDCICAALNDFISEVKQIEVAHAVRMELDMFDIGIGQSLVEGEKIINLKVQGEDEDGPGVLIMAFGQAEAMKLIHLFIRGFEENWPNDDDA